MKLSRDNHYVPIWYQKRFLSSDSAAFHYLNLNPGKKKLSDGRVIHFNAIKRPFYPKQCFYQTDLYTTEFFGFLNDEIERYLFGQVDNDGAIAVAAMADQNLSLIHKYHKSFFEYMDIQKLRTPKGLAWVKSKFPKLTHNELLLEMQRVRMINCTLWAESVKEIVSAKSAGVKFLISDHPVTTYNYACNPVSPECAFPNDPRIEMKSTQTIFPLDRDRCLILTNLDYARNPNLKDPTTNRPNANPGRDTLLKIDNTICTRELSDSEVLRINSIIKCRAKQFVAAENKDWLYPEKSLGKISWKELGEVLRPPEDELYHYGGEVYIGYEDGSSSFHDAYGRTQDVGHLQKEKPKKKIGANDYCPCGSGKKYKKCCRGRSAEECPDSSVLSIRERNIILFNAISDILKLGSCYDWKNIRDGLTTDQIIKIHEVVAALWPKESEIMALMPRPDSRVVRALFSGDLDPQYISRNINAFLLFADEILVQSPFPNPNVLHDDYNPLKKPDLYRQETLKNVMFLMSVMPLVELGVVVLFPDPLHHYPKLREEVFTEAEGRKNEVPVDLKSAEGKMLEQYKRSIFSLPDDMLSDYFRSASPELSDEELSNLVEYAKIMRERDPVVSVMDDCFEGQLLIGHMAPNFEMSMFIAQSTGSILFTDEPHRWKEIKNYIPALSLDDPMSVVSEFIQKLEVDTAFLYDPNEYLRSRQTSEIQCMKTAFKKLMNRSQSGSCMSKNDADDMAGEMERAREKLGKAVKRHNSKYTGNSAQHLSLMKIRLSSLVCSQGHKANSVYRLLMMYAGHSNYLTSVPISLFLEHPNENGIFE